MHQQSSEENVEQQRSEILHRLERWLEWPMIALAFVWLALLIIEFVRGTEQRLETASLCIWLIFIADFVLRFTVAPRKWVFLRSNWLTLLSLVVPAFRVFRIFAAIRLLRLASVARGLRFIRVVGSINRGMRALGTTMSRRGFGYVVLLTAIVTVAGAAGMHAFEKDVPAARPLHSFGSALWWTAMIITTMGSEYWPQTTAGRLLCFLLALYAFAVFGYVTATLATFFIGRDAEEPDAAISGQKGLHELRSEISMLRAELRQRKDGGGDAP